MSSTHEQDPPFGRRAPARRGARRAIAGLLLALGGLAALQPAQARPDVQWAVTIGTPVYRGPVYGTPVYLPAPPVYVQPAPVIYAAPAYGYDDYPERWRPAPRHHHHHHGRDGYRDSDRDGVPDRWDRQPGNPWRR